METAPFFTPDSPSKEKLASSSPIEQAAANLILKEKTAWDVGVAFITDRLAFQMRNLIRTLRKNYWGVFEQPDDPQTGKRKIWPPLTEYLVEASVKNIDLDTKDISFRAKKSSAQPFASVVRQAVHNFLQKIHFGELLDMAERQLGIDGTVIWKTYEEPSEYGKKNLCVTLVDPLNFYIDPTAESIRTAESVIERSLMMPDEFKKMTGWINTDGLTGTTMFNRYDAQLPYTPSTTQGTVKMREVFERWGRMPKYLITGKEEDEDIQVEGHVIASSAGSDWVVHLVEENTKKFPDGSPKRPYEECWYTKVHGRWYGKGIAEKVMWLQLYLNSIFNIRLNRQQVQQLGLFQIRAGSNITPQMISRLVSNGAIKVTDIGKDIAPLEFPQSGLKESYQDEENIINWGQKITSLFDVATGDPLPADTPATTAAIQAQNAKSQFTLIKEGIGMFLERWITNHVLPYVVENLDEGEVIRLTGEPNEIRQLDEWMVDGELADFIKKATKQKKAVSFQEIMVERQRRLTKLQQAGRDRFIEIDTDFDPTEYDVEVMITNEEVDKNVLVQNLVSMMKTVPPELQGGIVAEVFDLMGLDANQLKNSPIQMSQPQPQGPQAGGQPQPNPMAQTLPQAMIQANTLHA